MQFAHTSKSFYSSSYTSWLSFKRIEVVLFLEFSQVCYFVNRHFVGFRLYYLKRMLIDILMISETELH